MKTVRKPDRRVERTRRWLRDALFDLIMEKGYDAVTVEEITRRADVGRTTFYLHFRDKEDLLMDSVQGLVDDLMVQLSDLHIEPGQDEPPSAELLTEAITITFKSVQQNAGVYRIILRGDGTHQVIRGLRRILIRSIHNLIESLAARQGTQINPQVPMEFFLNSLAGSWVGLVTWWLENDMPYTPAEMASMFTTMFGHSIPFVLGVRPASDAGRGRVRAG